MYACPHKALAWRTIVIILGWAVIALSNTEVASATGTSVKRTIREYALTSANDFPERDPQDWRLLGSNDGGETWTALDTRTGEIFPRRHQRRIFIVTNTAPFDLYRLQIDRVHAPSIADAVQLAEIEPIDAGTLPIFCDAISAQDENLPSESADQVFDGRAETKWLDFAAKHPATRASWIQWCYLDHSELVLTNLYQLQALRARAAESFPIRLEGILVGRAKPQGQLCVLDPTGFININLSQPAPEASPGQKVLLEGTSQWIDGHATVSQPRLQILDPPAPGKPKQIKIEEPVSESDEFRWVEVEGQVQFLTQVGDVTAFDLVENGHHLSVRVLHSDPSQKPLIEGSRVRVRGICEGVLNQDGIRVAGIIWASSMDSVSLFVTPTTLIDGPLTGAQPPAARQPGYVLTQIDQIRRLSWAELSTTPKVKVRGVITDTAGTCIQDATGGIEISFYNGTNRQAQSLGTYVELEGRCVLVPGHGPTGTGPVIEAESIRRLGTGKLPDPVRPSWSLLASRQTDAQWVEVDTVVRATDGSHLLLACQSGQLTAAVRMAPVTAVSNLLDATIRVRGVSLAANDARGQIQGGVELVVPSLSFIQILQPPTDVTRLPSRRISTLRQIRESRELIHRVKITGLLTGIDNNSYFVQDDSGGALAIAKEDIVLNLAAGGWWSFWQTPRSNSAVFADPSLRIGDSVEIIGFPETREYTSVLTEATLHKTSPIQSILPVKTTAEELGRGKLASTLVTLEGLVQGSESLGNLLVFQIQSGLKIFRAVLPVNGKQNLRIAAGSRVRVTGVCQIEPVSHAELGKRPADFSLRLRDASDIALLELPPWLSVRRAIAVAGGLMLILLLAVAWIRLLHRQVALRTGQLEQKIVEHERAESLLAGKTDLLQQEIEQRKGVQAEVERIHKQLLTTSRLAGMADVATNVLHNVGNVLNSVNVLAASIASHLKKSRVGSVSKVAALLNQHETDLGRFISEDPNGRHIPEHLERLGTHLSEEQSHLLEKVKSLSESVEHIKEIVAMQQNYAKVSGLRETVAIEEIVEDALRMCSGALSRHEITVKRDYEPLPPMILDRHKALQILFNLLENAKHACWETHSPDKQITVKIKQHGRDRLRIEVIDNGIGITPANLKKIFTQGFTTRKNGHGFGLHSSILAAQDMGGTLTSQANTPARGAAFTLEIPLIPFDAKDHKDIALKALGH